MSFGISVNSWVTGHFVTSGQGVIGMLVTGTFEPGVQKEGDIDNVRPGEWECDRCLQLCVAWPCRVLLMGTDMKGIDLRGRVLSYGGEPKFIISCRQITL
jgi:hypothetical protein